MPKYRVVHYYLAHEGVNDVEANSPEEAKDMFENGLVERDWDEYVESQGYRVFDEEGNEVFNSYGM